MDLPSLPLSASMGEPDILFFKYLIFLYYWHERDAQQRTLGTCHSRYGKSFVMDITQDIHVKAEGRGLPAFELVTLLVNVLTSIVIRERGQLQKQ